MARRLNWQRNSYQLRARRGGSINLADERERLADDRAARWLNRHQAHRPAKHKEERKAERLRQHAQRLRERDIRRKVRAGKLVLWGDSWSDAPASSSISSSTVPPWERATTNLGSSL